MYIYATEWPIEYQKYDTERKTAFAVSVQLTYAADVVFAVRCCSSRGRYFMPIGPTAANLQKRLAAV